MQYTAIFHDCKNDNFQMKIFDIFLIFAQNIDCGYTLEPPQRGGSNEYPQSMFWSKNKKNMYTRVNPTFSTGLRRKDPDQNPFSRSRLCGYALFAQT